MKQLLMDRAKSLAGINGKDQQYWLGLMKIIDKFNDAKINGEFDPIHVFFNTCKPTVNSLKTGYQSRNDTYGAENEYFHQCLEVFCAVVQKQIDADAHLPKIDLKPDYDVLITLLGFSPQPLMYTILTLKPEKVCLVATKESAVFDKICAGDYFQFLIDKFEDENLSADNRKVKAVSNGRPLDRDDFPETRSRIKIEKLRLAESIGAVDTFRKTRELIQEIRKEKPNARIAVDITGGKKSMDASAFLTAAVEDDIDIFYVDFEGYGEGKPVCGTEFLNRLDNPYQLYNIREEELLKEFWERKDYAQADRIVSKLLDDFGEEKAETYGLDKERERYLQIQEAAKCYAAWSDFNYELARHHRGFDFYRGRQQNVLSDLMPCPDKRKTAKGAIYLAADRWMRGSDFLEKEELHKAALCFTQAIELLSEYRFEDLYGLNVFDKTAIEKNRPCGNVEFGKTPLLIAGLIGFLFGDNHYKIKSINLKLSWIDRGRQFRRQDKPEGIFDALKVRNELAHFNCFSETAMRKNYGKVNVLKAISKGYAEFFITKAYSNEMGTERFDDIREKLGFAEFGCF
jgi:hypothetical protein